MIRVEFESIRRSKSSERLVVILKDVECDDYLPIWTGIHEGAVIASELQGVSDEFTDNLIKTVVQKSEIKHVLIKDLINNVYYAEVEMENEGQSSKLDLRPSDALALAARLKVPVFVNVGVMMQARTYPPYKPLQSLVELIKDTINAIFRV